ncbi:alpha/beta hydrolase [Azospirillum sp. sgz302134]
MRVSLRALVPAALAALLVGSAASGAAAQSTAQSNDGPPDSWTRYWTVPGFPEIAARGPAKAKGVIFWSHGLNGKWPEYQHPPATLLQRLAADGWDVLKINRNNLFETGWAEAGMRHIDDLVQRAEEARRQGYKRVVAAGQSYGGAITLEAGARFPFDAIIALAPGSGSDAKNAGSVAMSWQTQADWLTRLLPKEQAARVVVFVPDQDEYFPSTTRGPIVREGLGKSGRAFVVIDERSPLKGHGAGTGGTFRAAYGSCLTHFLDAAPNAGETRCPDPPADFDILLPDDLSVAKPAPTVPKDLAAYSGRWVGVYDGNGRAVQIVVERIEGRDAHLVIAVGRGPDRRMASDWTRRKASFDAGNALRTGGSGNGFTMTLRPDGKADLLWESKERDRSLKALLTPVP